MEFTIVVFKSASEQVKAISDEIGKKLGVAVLLTEEIKEDKVHITLTPQDSPQVPLFWILLGAEFNKKTIVDYSHY